MKRLALVLLSLVVCCLAAVPAHADSVPACTPDMSMASLGFVGCASGNLLFTNFQYNNSGGQISPGDFVTANDILVTATPFSVTFSTNYGPNGGFANCINYQLGGCVEDEGSIDYDVSVIKSGGIAGLGLFGGVQGPSLFRGAGVSEVGCLGAGNIANRSSYPSPNIQNDVIGGVSAVAGTLSDVCPENPSSSVLLNANLAINYGPETVFHPRVALFSPVSAMSLAAELYVASASDLTPFSTAFLVVPEPTTLLLLIPGLLALAVFRLKKATA